MILARHRHDRRAAGHSLIEVVIATILLAVVIGPVVMIAGSGQRAFQTSTMHGDLEVRGRRTLDRIVRELMSSTVGSMGTFPEWPSHEERLDFDQVVDVAESDGTITWERVRIEFQYGPGETNDGTDENENGLIDDASIALIRDPGVGAQATTLCTFVREYLEGEIPNGLDDNGNGLVDERGLCFQRTGDTLTIHLTLERVDHDGDLATRTFETSILLRN